jgi:outer membrane protein
MKPFLQTCIGIALVITSMALMIHAVQPAYGEEQDALSPRMQEDQLKILYVNIDSINQNYLAFASLSQEAGDSLQRLMTQYQELATDMQNRYTKLQEQVNMGTISTDAAEREEKAINEGLDLLKRQETNLAYMESNAMQKNDSISQIIALYLREYCIKRNVDYVMMFGTGMPIIYANDNLDITAEVLKDLNAQYTEDQKKKAGSGK